MRPSLTARRTEEQKFQAGNLTTNNHTMAHLGVMMASIGQHPKPIYMSLLCRAGHSALIGSSGT